MKTLSINLVGIDSWSQFHEYFAHFEDFPSYYGRNMDAWIDVMQDYYDEAYLIKIYVDGPPNAYRKNPFYNAILDCIAFINYRKVDEGSHEFVAVAAIAE